MPSTADWPDTPAGARALQVKLARQVRLAPGPQRVERIAGVDSGFIDGGRTARAAVVVLGWPALEPLAAAVAERPTPMPYVPGLLSFRELPAVLDALERLAVTPDLVLCDGQGIAHPRRLGIAAHLGVLTGLPSIGVGKSRLTGTHEEPDAEKGSWVPLLDGGERIGTVLRSRTGVRPLWVSPGHQVDHDGAVAWVLACCRRYRLPEPIRAADRLASRRGAGSGFQVES